MPSCTLGSGAKVAQMWHAGGIERGRDTAMSGKSFGTVRKMKSGRFQARYKYRLVEYKCPHGTFRTKGQASAWLEEERKLIDLNVWTPPEERAKEQEQKEQADLLTVGIWLERFHDGLNQGVDQVRRSTMQTYLRRVNNRILKPLAPGNAEPDITRLKDIPLAQLTKADVYRWWDAVQRVYDTPSTNKATYVRLKAACAEAVRRELIPTNPVDIPAAAKRTPQKDKHLPTDQELHSILKNMSGRYKLITVLIFFHGLRIGEAIALEREHLVCEPATGPGEPLRWFVKVKQNAQRLTEKHSYMFIQPTKTGAGVRTVPLMQRFNDVVQEHLDKYLSAKPVTVKTWEGERKMRLLTTTETGAILMDTSYRSRLNTAKGSAGVKSDITPHSGRRWVITRLAEQGAHVKEIGRIVGDDDMETIMEVYMLVRAERTTELIDKLDLSVEKPADDDQDKDTREQQGNQE